MDPVMQRRRTNLLALADAAGGRSALAQRLDTSVVQLNHIVGKNPVRNLGEKLARRWEQKLGLGTGWLDVEHTGDTWAKAAFPAKAANGVLIANEPTAFPLKAGAIYIDQLDVRASMGGGGTMLPDRESVIDSLRVSEAWVRENFPYVTSVSNLKIITGFGDSMFPTIRHGDPIIVDVGVNTMDIDTIYVFAYQEELYIKRIQRMPDKALKVISDNRAMYDPYILTAEQRAQVHVIARVICPMNLNKIA